MWNHENVIKNYIKLVKEHWSTNTLGTDLVESNRIFMTKNLYVGRGVKWVFLFPEQYLQRKPQGFILHHDLWQPQNPIIFYLDQKTTETRNHLLSYGDGQNMSHLPNLPFWSQNHALNDIILPHKRAKTKGHP